MQFQAGVKFARPFLKMGSIHFDPRITQSPSADSDAPHATAM